MTKQWHSITRQQAAELLGCSVQHFHDRVRPRLPAGAETGDPNRGTLRFDMRAVLAAKLSYEREQAERRGSFDSMMVGETSPAIERYREARAQIAEFELEQRQQNIVHPDEVAAGLGVLIDKLRAAAARVGDRFDADAEAMITDAIDEADQGWDGSL